MIVIDSSALLAFLLREPGHEIVTAQLAQASMSTVNFSEVLARMSRENIAPRTLGPKLLELGLTLVEFDPPQAVIASEIRESARTHGIAMSGCCCIALAMHQAMPVLTADRAWTSLGFDVDVQLIR